MNNKYFLVIGANGKTGSRVSSLLQGKSLPVKRASRSSKICFDWQDKSNWADVLRDVEAMYVSYFPDLSSPDAQNDLGDLCNIAIKCGVKHCTLLSSRGEPNAQACEELVKSSGMSWTIIRSSWFAQNFSEGLFHHGLQRSLLELPVKEVKEPFIDVDDVAEIAFNSLINSKHRNQLYEVTGPELLSFADVIERHNRIFDKSVTFKQVSFSKFEKNMTCRGFDNNTVSLLKYLFSEVLDGRNEYLSDGVLKALSRPPKSISRFLITSVDRFI